MLYALGNHRAHGVALLVAVSFHSISAIAQWSMNDSYRLDQIYLQLGGDYNSSHSIHSDLTEILSFQRRDFNVATNTYSLLDSFFDVFRSVLSPDLSGGFQAVKTDLVLDGYTPYVHPDLPYDPRISAELLVTNRSLPLVQNTLEYIATNVHNSYYVPFDPDIYFAGYVNSPYPSDGPLNQYYSMMVDYYSAQRNRDFTQSQSLYKDILRKYGSWKWQALQTYLVLNPNVLIGNRLATNGMVRTLNAMLDVNNVVDGNMNRVYRDSYYDQYSTRSLREYLTRYYNNSGISADILNPTNFFTADGSIENTDNAFTNSDTSVFSKFATSFLPSGMFDPDELDTNLFEYVDSEISESPSFNPAPISGNGGLRSSADSFDYDFDDSSGDYDYNLLNPLKTATDKVQQDTDLDNKFDQLAGLVNQRINAIFQNPLNSISFQPARWQASLIDKDMNETEHYVDPQYSKSSDGVQFVCWVCESMMFFTFFTFCVRRSLRVQQSRDVASAI